MHLFEFGTWHPLHFTPDKLKRLKAYLHTIWQNRHVFFQPSPTNESTQRMFDFDEHHIRARNYVGFLRFEGQDIYVLPKIFASQASTPSPNLCFAHLLYYLGYSQRVRFPFSLARTHTSHSLLLPEICIFLFASYTEHLLTEQPLHLYQERTEELDFLKGQLAIDQYLKENIATGNWQKLQSRYAPLLYDNQFNQLVKYTARWLLSVSQHAPSLARLQRIIALLQNVSDVSMTYEDCLKIRLPEAQAAQQAIADMCAMFLGNEMINYEAGQKYNFAFLLPMELVYEDFVAGFVQTHCAQWHPQRHPKQHLATTNQGKAVFSLQPDLWLNKLDIITDTKYKIREAPFRNAQTAVEESDIYQMLGYAVGYRCTHVVLLYPVSYGQQRASTPSETFSIESELLSKPVQISAESINITTSQTGAQFTSVLEQGLKKQLGEIFGA